MKMRMRISLLLAVILVSLMRKRGSLCRLIRKQVSLAVDEKFEEEKHTGKEWEKKHQKFVEKRKSFNQNEYPTKPIEEETIN